MEIIDGKKIAATIKDDIKRQVAEIIDRGDRAPHLAAIIVGDDPASHTYVNGKEKACQEVGFTSSIYRLPASTKEEELLKIVQFLNNDDEVDGFIVQVPLPKHINETTILQAIRPSKDVDGFHPVNVAKLALEDPSGFVPCTPLGCRRLLLEYGIPTSGARVVVLGRSMIVGKPLALLLMSKGPGGDAIVTVAHSRTRNLGEITREADIIFSAIGRPYFLREEHVREGAVVVDVGINRVEDPSHKRGYRLVGDVDFETVAPKCSLITPVPGGVGPMTIAMLLSNTLKACRQIHGLPG